jgi:3-deoxy-7-phosphoheptulonate synthase
LIVEVHDQPERALSDGAQSLNLEQYDQLMQEVRAIHEALTPAAVS